MTNREVAIDLIQRLPEGTSLLDIAKEIEFIAGVREGFDQIDRREEVPAEEVRRLIPSWTTSNYFATPILPFSNSSNFQSS